MAKAAERVLGRRIAAGFVNVKYGHATKLRHIELNECGHPEPDARGMAGAERHRANRRFRRARRSGNLPHLGRRFGADAAAR